MDLAFYRCIGKQGLENTFVLYQHGGMVQRNASAISPLPPLYQNLVSLRYAVKLNRYAALR